MHQWKSISVIICLLNVAQESHDAQYEDSNWVVPQASNHSSLLLSGHPTFQKKKQKKKKEKKKRKEKKKKKKKKQKQKQKQKHCHRIYQWKNKPSDINFSSVLPRKLLGIEYNDWIRLAHTSSTRNTLKNCPHFFTKKKHPLHVVERPHEGAIFLKKSLVIFRW